MYIEGCQMPHTQVDMGRMIATESLARIKVRMLTSEGWVLGLL